MPSMLDDGRLIHRTPRWVKAVAMTLIAFLLLFGSLHLIGARYLGHALSAHGNRASPANATDGSQRP